MNEGRDLLESRIRAVPDALRRTAVECEPRLAPAIADARGVVSTGVGSSRAHARFLAHLLAEHAGVDARFSPTGALAEKPPTGAAARVLVVFSQGLSPNACLPLAHRDRWHRVILVTASSAASGGERGRRFREVVDDGVDVVRFAGEDEFGLLLRVVGPACGYLAAHRLARSLGEALGGGGIPRIDVEDLAAAVEAAPRRVPPVDAETLAAPLAFLATGGYGELAENLALKVLEGLLRPSPPIWDLLELAHGPFQQRFDERTTFLVLARRHANTEPELLERARAMLDPDRHRMIPLVAELPGPLAVFEHEAQMNEILRRALAAGDADLTRWPGRGRDRPLYAVDHLGRASPSLADLTWPELEQAIDAGRSTLVIPLGATEQHGPHLPFATDSWIAEELAKRFCRRVPEAIAAPVLAVGCSSEHAAFPGTLSLEPETLERVLADLLRPLHGHGFARAYLFSAHGGNVAILRDMAPRLRRAAAPLDVVLFHELDSLTADLQAESARFGIGAEASGHHAGELETSILAALRPAAVRSRRFEAGWVTPTEDPQKLFYPSLRDHAPNGVVGDPRGADAARAETYLEAWVSRLVVAYRSRVGTA